MDHAYFSRLETALIDDKRFRPTLVLDKARLAHNVAAIRDGVAPGYQLRVVDKSLAVPKLLAFVTEHLRTDRIMTFHLPVTKAVAQSFPNAEFLLGKPMPVAAAGLVVGEPHGPRITWLIDTSARLQQYGDLARQSGQILSIVFEVNVGLNRGGLDHPDQLSRCLEFMTDLPLKCMGIMGYEAHANHLPKLLGGGTRELNKVRRRIAEFVAQLGPDQRQIINTAGSSTIFDHPAGAEATELSVGSLAVLPSDFDAPASAHLKPAVFIATPILKQEDLAIPGLDRLSVTLRRLNLMRRKAVYLYSGKWMANPVYPAGMKPQSQMGQSSNQTIYTLPNSVTVEPDSYCFLRPTQSEFVLQQFGDIAVFDGEKIGESWPAIPLR